LQITTGLRKWDTAILNLKRNNMSKKEKKVKAVAPKLDAVIRRDGSTTINNNATSRRYKS
tara:strand:+ start:143 stop:322 length:180 start_codon:yes stop_codon:yes gene_type:complete